MLHLQAFLRNGGTITELEERGIRCYKHPTEDLFGFKYNQIDANRSCPIVRECRGIVLEFPSWNLIAKGFNRFFNLGEFPDEQAAFDWNNFLCTNKEDGSLILLYHWNGSWHVNTSGSFGLGQAGIHPSFSWQELFWDAMGGKDHYTDGLLNSYFTYIFELCTPYNKVVRAYKKPAVFLLSLFSGEDEADMFQTRNEADRLGIPIPDTSVLTGPNGKESILSWLKVEESRDRTFEGFVLRDRNNYRIKVKTPSYLALHHIKDNGNILIPKRLVALVLGGADIRELTSVMPEITSALQEVDLSINGAIHDVVIAWGSNLHLESQKDFALKVKDLPFASILFDARKRVNRGEAVNIADMFCAQDAEKVSDKLFGKRTFSFDVAGI